MNALPCLILSSIVAAITIGTMLTPSSAAGVDATLDPAAIAPSAEAAARSVPVNSSVGVAQQSTGKSQPAAKPADGLTGVAGAKTPAPLASTNLAAVQRVPAPLVWADVPDACIDSEGHVQAARRFMLSPGTTRASAVVR